MILLEVSLTLPPQSIANFVPISKVSVSAQKTFHIVTGTSLPMTSDAGLFCLRGYTAWMSNRSRHLTFRGQSFRRAAYSPRAFATFGATTDWQ